MKSVDRDSEVHRKCRGAVGVGREDDTMCGMGWSGGAGSCVPDSVTVNNTESFLISRVMWQRLLLRIAP